MDLTPYYQEMLLRISNGYYDSGVSCTYIPLTDNYAVKLYRYSKTNNWCYRLQKLASLFNLAPKVLGKFKLPIEFHEYDVRYGHVTEIADTTIKVTYDNIVHLNTLLAKVGISNPDLHYGNVGWMDNRLVCIDFDCAAIVSYNP